MIYPTALARDAQETIFLQLLAADFVERGIPVDPAIDCHIDHTTGTITVLVDRRPYATIEDDPIDTERRLITVLAEREDRRKEDAHRNRAPHISID